MADAMFLRSNEEVEAAEWSSSEEYDRLVIGLRQNISGAEERLERALTRHAKGATEIEELQLYLKNYGNALDALSSNV